jgi:Ca2+-transporting ATPase
MVTGDHVVTADAVAAEVGLREGLVMPGRELRTIPEADLDAHIREYKAFARVDPLDKVKIVRSHQRDGSLVAMTGDGVNDAPALRVADIGIAMGSGTDVAREASALVLADDNYATIVAAIAEGRRIFGNLRNVVHYLLSANTAEVLYMVAGFLAFGFLGEPLLAVQLLWINLLSDALPALALGMDEPTHNVMQDQPGEGRDILSRQNLLLLLGQGIVLAVATGATLYAGYVVLDLDYETARTMAFSTLVLAQLVHAINVRSANAKLSWPRPFLTWSILFSALLQVVVIYLPMGQRVFDTVALGPAEWLWVLGISAAAFAGSRALYVIFWKRKERVAQA